MRLKLFLIVLVVRTRLFRCSTVIDMTTHDGIYVKDYCQKWAGCSEGTHTMCMFYTPGKVGGPRCFNFQKLAISDDLANLLMGMVNEIRGRISMGNETGVGNALLPRGYGLFKVKWDPELATFAQVMANTCIKRFDICRATKKFLDPGQLVSTVRFTIPDWIPVQHTDVFQDKEKGLTHEKLEHAAREAIKAFYQQKQYVTKEDIESVPDFEKQHTKQGKTYLQLIDGGMTHMGCGISGYSEYSYHIRKNDPIIYNSVHVTCNFSSQPKKGTPVYNTVRKSPEEMCPRGDKYCVKRYDSKCGCPPGTGEEDRCLCTEPITYSEEEDQPDHMNFLHGGSACGKGQNCKPAVVLLPIFTVEDAPHHKITMPGTHEDPLDNMMVGEVISSPERSGIMNKNEIEDSYLRNMNKKLQTYIMNSLEPPFIQKKVSVLKNEDNDHSEMRKNANYRVIPRKKLDKKKQSIFAKAPKFELCNTAGKSQSHLYLKPTTVATLKDVAPRKDFSNAKEVLDKYLDRKRQKETMKNGYVEQNKENISFKSTTSPSPIIDLTLLKNDNNFDEHNLNETISKIKSSMNRLSENKHNYQNLKGQEDTKDRNEEQNTDKEKTLMKLLDTLEHEVNNVQLDGNEKKNINAKIKKIYGSFLKKHPIKGSNLSFDKETKPERVRQYDPDFYEDGLSDSLDDPNKNIFDKKITDTKEIINKLHSKRKNPSKSLYERPLPRDQNTLRPLSDNNVNFVFRNTFSDVDDMDTKKYNKNSDRYSDSEVRIKEDYVGSDNEEVKVLPQKFIHKINHNEYDNIISRFPTDSDPKISKNRNELQNTYEKPIKNFGPESDETGRNFNRIDSKKGHYDDLANDYEIKSRNQQTHNGKDYGDYVDDRLSSERMKFYYDKLTDLQRNTDPRYLNKANSDHNIESGSRRRSRIPDLSDNESNGSRRFYVPKRALSRIHHVVSDFKNSIPAINTY